MRKIYNWIETDSKSKSVDFLVESKDFKGDVFLRGRVKNFVDKIIDETDYITVKIDSNNILTDKEKDFIKEELRLERIKVVFN